MLAFSRGGSHLMFTWCPCMLYMEEVMHLLVPGCHPHHLALDDCPLDLFFSIVLLLATLLRWILFHLA